MKRLLIGFLFLGIAAMFAFPALAVDVYPSGLVTPEPSADPGANRRYTAKYTLDILEVRAAVNGGLAEDYWDVVKQKEDPPDSGNWVYVEDMPYPFSAVDSDINYGVGGGTVLMHSHKLGEIASTAYYFGPANVVVLQSAIIEGETDESPIGVLTNGTPLTKIIGGVYTFFVTKLLADTSPGYPTVTIRNIRFEGSASAIRVHKYEKATIQNNIFEKGILGISPITQQSTHFSVGIVGPNFGPALGWGHIGETLVSNNYFDLFPAGHSSGQPVAEVATAVFLADINELGHFGSTSDNSNSYITIKDNEIHNPGLAGISIRSATAAQSIDVTGNDIYQRDGYDFYFEALSDLSLWMQANPAERALTISMGIYATGFRIGTTNPAVKNDGYPKTGNIKGNNIYGCPTRGIVLANAQNMVVQGNSIDMSGVIAGSAAIALTADHFAQYNEDYNVTDVFFPRTQDNTFIDNTITGTADYDVYCSKRTEDNIFTFSGIKRSDLRIKKLGKRNTFKFIKN